MKKPLNVTNKDIEAIKIRALDLYRDTVNVDIEPELLSQGCLVVATIQYFQQKYMILPENSIRLLPRKFYESVDEG